ncbi:MAG: hypothetical protein MHPSP_001124, partial [Paramarteilia canceri]
SSCSKKFLEIFKHLIQSKYTLLHHKPSSSSKILSLSLTGNDLELRSLIALSIMRFVNYIHENSAQMLEDRLSMAQNLERLQIPEWILKLRNNIAHSTFPDLEILANALEFCFNFILSLAEFGGTVNWEKESFQTSNIQSCMLHALFFDFNSQKIENLIGIYKGIDIYALKKGENCNVKEYKNLINKFKNLLSICNLQDFVAPFISQKALLRSTVPKDSQVDGMQNTASVTNKSAEVWDLLTKKLIRQEPKLPIAFLNQCFICLGEIFSEKVCLEDLPKFYCELLRFWIKRFLNQLNSFAPSDEESSYLCITALKSLLNCPTEQTQVELESFLKFLLRNRIISKENISQLMTLRQQIAVSDSQDFSQKLLKQSEMDQIYCKILAHCS